MPAPESAPALPALYARALTGARRRHRGGDLPERVLEVGPQLVDPDHLAAYDRVCGFRYCDVLPPTYPHVLGFALQLALMTDDHFPFPLLGLVHVANAVTVRVPIRSSDRPAFAVHAANLRPHPAGQQFDVFTEARIDGEPVWLGRSTYLRRERRTAPGQRPDAPGGRSAARRERPPLEPQQGALVRLGAPADTGRRYAAVSGDRNPIHLSRLSARVLGFPAAIAHGMWLKARVLATLEGRLPDACTADVTFRAPVLLPARLDVAAVRERAEWTLDVRSGSRRHLLGTAG
jgi:acyl dehydratase